MFSFLALVRELFFFIGHIGTGTSFPAPLSAEEEKKAIEALMAGSDDAREKLIVHNLRLAAHIARKYAKSGRDREDLISIGTIGLIKAVSTFCPGKGALSGYASKCIENEILMSLRQERKLVPEVSMEEPIGTDKEGNALSLLDLIGTDGEAIFDQVQQNLEQERIVRAMQACLNQRERIVLTLRFGLCGETGHAQREIAKLLGISRSYVSRIEKKAMQKLSAALKA